ELLMGEHTTPSPLARASQPCARRDLQFRAIVFVGSPVGMVTDTSVPSCGPLVTTSVAPRADARSRIPTRPQCPGGRDCVESKPRPSSRTAIINACFEYWHETVTVRHCA